MTTTLMTSNPIELEKWYQNWRKEQTKARHILEGSSAILLTTWYAEQVVKRKIVASKKVILACKRHLRDLKRAGTDEFPYVFDEKLGHRPIRFIEKYCKPSKGDSIRLVLQPWQHFVIGSLYGWVHRDTGVRRFREGLIFIGRKNGKTTMISGLANFALSKDGENGARIYVLANSKQQAGELFDESRAMVQSSPPLRKRYRENQKGIFYDKTKSRIEPRASDSQKLDGLNTHLGIFDEIHEFRDYKLINVIKKSRGARKQPLILYITTAGYQLDGPLINFYDQADGTLNGDLIDDRTFYFMAELDDEKEFDQPEMWIKANPNIGVSLDLPTMIDDWKKDKQSPEERTDYITKQFNLFVNATKLPFVDYEVLKRNNKTLDDFSLLENVPAIGGYDLSNTEDFTSACLVFPNYEPGEIFVLSHSWVPEKKVKKEEEKLPYYDLKREGLLTIVEGEYVKEEDVLEWFWEQSQRFTIELITYDPAKAFRLNKALQEKGFVTDVVRQGFITLGPAMDDLKHLFIDGKVNFNNNRLLRWYINNVELVLDRNNNKMPKKSNRYRKIDGFAAMLNAHTKVMEKLVTPTAGTGKVGVVSLNDLRG